METTDVLAAADQVGKRRSYVIFIGLAFAVMLLLWATTGAESSVVALATYPARAVFLAGVLAGLVSGRLSVRATERLILVAMTLFFLARTGLILFGPTELLSTSIDLVEPMLLGALLYPLMFLSFDTPRALRLSLVTYGAFGSLVVCGVTSELLTGVVTERTAIILAATAVHGAMIALLWVLSSRKEMLASERTRAASLETQANTDLLTGVANRRRLEFELDHRLAESTRYGALLSVIIIDLDKFKVVNDQYGHDMGDQVLRGAVERLSRALRATDMLGRWGGEEFVVIAPGIGAEGAACLAERCRSTVTATPFPRVGQVSASFGVASYRVGDSLRSLLRRADEALYESKTGGRNRVSVAN